MTVQTGDQGSVTVTEPAWCIDPHGRAAFRADISHYGPAVVVTVGTVAGPRELLTLTFTKHLESMSDAWPSTALHVTAHLADGKHHPYDAAGLERLAVDLVDAAREVRHMARRLAVELSRGGAL